MLSKHIKTLKDKTEIVIRHATENDLFAINDIYNYYVVNSTCTFQIVPETIESRQMWFSEHGDDYPVLVAESNHVVIAWASISRYKKREAYKLTIESSIYTSHDKLSYGIGSILIEEIIKLSRTIGYHCIIAGISADQVPSIKLHEKYGFTKVAHLKEVGYKFDKWLDVVYYQLLC